MSGAPSVNISLSGPPLELQGVKNLKADGYASFCAYYIEINVVIAF